MKKTTTTITMYEVNVNNVLCFPAINSGLSSKFGSYCRHCSFQSSGLVSLINDSGGESGSAY